MYSKEMVLNNCYQELSDVLFDLLKYEFVGMSVGDEVITLVNKMVVECGEMVDHAEDLEWSDVMKVKQSYYQVVRMVNVLLINNYDKIISHKNK